MPPYYRCYDDCLPPGWSSSCQKGRLSALFLISYLESEMYQLSHLLTEQKSSLESIPLALLPAAAAGASAGEDTAGAGPRERGAVQAGFLPGPAGVPREGSGTGEEGKQRTLTTLLEKVEGCRDLLETPGQYLVYNGDLVEYDADHMAQLQRVHGFLMNDCLLVATWLPQRRGMYRYNALYPLDRLAVVNVKDNPPMKDMFKLLMFPESRIFQAENAKISEQRQLAWCPQPPVSRCIWPSFDTSKR